MVQIKIDAVPSSRASKQPTIPTTLSKIWSDGAVFGILRALSVFFLLELFFRRPFTSMQLHVDDVDVDDSIDWMDSIFIRQNLWNKSPIVIESHKLLFFAVPKNGCSTFKRLFRRMMGHENWQDRHNVHNPEFNGLKYLGHYPRSKQKEFMTSQDWTRAIFVRDPLERALSAYMDNGLHFGPSAWKPVVQGAHIKRQCCRVGRDNPACEAYPLSPYHVNLTEENFPFEDFVKFFMQKCEDDHWAPQSSRMHTDNWKWINFVGHFETLQNDTRSMLEQIGAYEEFGASGWNGSSDVGNNTPVAIFQKNSESHKTSARDLLHHYHTPETERLVFDFYRRDYELKLFNITTSGANKFY